LKHRELGTDLRESLGVIIRAARPDERVDVDRLLVDQWGDGVARKGELVGVRGLPALIAIEDGDIAGVLAYAVRGDECEVVSLHAVDPGHGTGRALMDAVLEVAVAEGCRRLWLVTTNDNTRALRFYQRWGMDVSALHHGAVDAARRDLKPSIPVRGRDDIPMRHEIELEREVTLPS
jgi:ribosomal protein S18 acetylase RimI-like enzyme